MQTHNFHTACNPEPFRKPDHKAKKHGRPVKGTYKRSKGRYEHDLWIEDGFAPLCAV